MRNLPTVFVTQSTDPPIKNGVIAVEKYYDAARIINVTGKTEIVTTSKHPIVDILRMMGEKGMFGIPWEGEYSRKIMQDLNLKSLQTDLNFMLENNITESNKFKKNFPTLSKIFKEFGFNMQYDEFNKKFITDFPLTQTDDESGHESSDESDENEEEKRVLETILAQNNQLNAQIAKLISENKKLRTSEFLNFLSLKSLKSQNEKLNDKNENLTGEIQVFKTQNQRMESEISNQANKIENLENELFEKMFQIPTENEETEIRNLFLSTRNSAHNIPQYNIKVEYYPKIEI